MCVAACCGSTLWLRTMHKKAFFNSSLTTARAICFLRRMFNWRYADVRIEGEWIFYHDRMCQSDKYQPNTVYVERRRNSLKNEGRERERESKKTPLSDSLLRAFDRQLERLKGSLEERGGARLRRERNWANLEGGKTISVFRWFLDNYYLLLVK